MTRAIRMTIGTLIILASISTGVMSASHRHHKHPVTPSSAQASSQITVWVNLNTGIYHYEGERWYGKTKNGQYMKEADAIKAGYRATENGQ